MTCKKCSYILYGSENYCPHCGEKCKEDDSVQNQKTETEPKPIFISRDPSFEDTASKNRIFQPETAYEEVLDSPELRARKKQKGVSRGLTALLSVFCVLLFCTAIFMAADYFGIVPAVADLFSANTTAPENTTDTPEGEFASSFGTVFPQINYAPVNCVVSSANSISLRKGPSDSYGQITFLKSGSEVQVIGGSSTEENWVYVYVSEEDLYGWLSASFISGNLPEAEEKSTYKNDK